MCDTAGGKLDIAINVNKRISDPSAIDDCQSGTRT
jgi:hypothetical protein